MEDTRISQIHTFCMTHIRMFRRKWDSILDIEREFLFDHLKWLASFLALQDATEECIDIFLGSLESDNLLIVFSYRKLLVVLPHIRVLVLAVIPVPSFRLHFLF